MSSTERSVRPIDVEMQRLGNQSTGSQSTREGTSSSRHVQHGHMTLDGRRRPRNNQNQDVPANSDDQWNDWTSTWRRMGNKGESKPVTMTGTITRGPHILLLSIIAFPFTFIASILVSFYFGALTWQNVFSHYYDERTIWHRLFICPILVLTFPIFILIFTLGIALYAAFIQLRWSFPDWRIEVSSLEKGFYGWLCGAIGMEDCSPYTVIELFGGEDSEPHQDQQDERIEVSYSQDNAISRHTRTLRSGSLPGTSGHQPMSRTESTM